MGVCIGIQNNDTETFSVSSTNVTRPATAASIGFLRKNHPICHETIRWRSDVPLTEGQLRSKRDEFWDTAPAFDGRKEIWDALRAVTLAAEELDFQLAQMILNGASITIPNGYLTECYDEYGTQYKVPIYCLSYPINIVREKSGRDSPAEYSEPVDSGVEVMLKLRLSTTGIDKKFLVFTSDTIGQCKKKLEISEGVNVRVCCQRWFYGGKLLGDKMLIEDANIQKGYIVQVIINPEHYNYEHLHNGNCNS